MWLVLLIISMLPLILIISFTIGIKKELKKTTIEKKVNKLLAENNLVFGDSFLENGLLKYEVLNRSTDEKIIVSEEYKEKIEKSLNDKNKNSN